MRVRRREVFFILKRCFELYHRVYSCSTVEFVIVKCKPVNLKTDDDNSALPEVHTSLQARPVNT